jgi:hypothetical protein
MNPLSIYIYSSTFYILHKFKIWFYSPLPIMHFEIWFKLDIRPTLVHTWYLNWYKVGIAFGHTSLIGSLLPSACLIPSWISEVYSDVGGSKTMLNTIQQTVPKLLRSLARLLNNRLDHQLIAVLFLLLVKQRWEIEPGHACAKSSQTSQ